MFRFQAPGRPRTSKPALPALALTLALTISATGHASADRPANPYPFGKSTYWAWQTRPDLPLNLGQAKDWARNAAMQGWPIGPYPRPGDVAVLQPGVQGADNTTGHVAFVRQVLDNGSYITTQMDEADCPASTSPTCGRVATRQYAATPGATFIHYVKDTRTTWGFAGGASGWTPINLGAGKPDTQGWSYPLMGGSPQLVSPDLEIPIDAYNVVEVQMAVNPGVANPTAQLFFATAAQPQFSPANSVRVRVRADGIMRAYTFFLGARQQWQGQLTRLRLDPTGPATTGTIRIQRVRLLNQTTPTYSTTQPLWYAH
jgi:surface antigen